MLLSWTDPIVELLEDGITDFPHAQLYSKDPLLGHWQRHVHMSTPHAGMEKYCTTCNVWRPLRGHPCRQCGYCIVSGAQARLGTHCKQTRSTLSRMPATAHSRYQCVLRHGSFSFEQGMHASDTSTRTVIALCLRPARFSNAHGLSALQSPSLPYCPAASV